MYFFVSVSRVTPRELFRSSTIDPFYGRKNYILGALLIVFSKFSIPKKSVPKKQKKNLDKNGKKYEKHVLDKINFVIQS